MGYINCMVATQLMMSATHYKTKVGQLNLLYTLANGYLNFPIKVYYAFMDAYIYINL